MGCGASSSEEVDLVGSTRRALTVDFTGSEKIYERPGQSSVTGFPTAFADAFGNISVAWQQDLDLADTPSTGARRLTESTGEWGTKVDNHDGCVATRYTNIIHKSDTEIWSIGATAQIMSNRALGYLRVSRSLNGGATWSSLSCGNGTFKVDLTGTNMTIASNGYLILYKGVVEYGGHYWVPAYGHLSWAGGADTRPRSMMLKSTDGGYTWKYIGTIADSYSVPRSYNETAIAHTGSGRFTALIRADSTNGGTNALYVAYSTNWGATWSTPQLMSTAGYVDPTIIENKATGRLVATFGRPHVWIMHSTANTGARGETPSAWTGLTKIFENRSNVSGAPVTDGSSGYSALVDACKKSGTFPVVTSCRSRVNVFVDTCKPPGTTTYGCDYAASTYDTLSNAPQIRHLEYVVP